MERRRDSIHALLATLLLSQGTPMLLAGDEHGHSQHGNNNAYCQDNALTWLDWQQANRGLTTFTAALIRLRQQIPALTGNSWWEEGDGNVRWLNKNAQPLSADEWQNGPKLMQILLSDRFLIAINATLEVTDIVLPEGEWRAVPPFAGEDNPVITAVWQDLRMDCVCSREDKKGVNHGEFREERSCNVGAPAAIEICCPNPGRRPRHASKRFNEQTRQTSRPLWWEVPHHRFRLI